MDTICSCPEELLSNRVQSSARSISSDGLRKAQFLGTPGSLTTSDISSPTRLAFETGCADMPPTGSDIRTRRPRICLKTGVGRRHLHDGTRQRIYAHFETVLAQGQASNQRGAVGDVRVSDSSMPFCQGLSGSLQTGCLNGYTSSWQHS